MYFKQFLFVILLAAFSVSSVSAEDESLEIIIQSIQYPHIEVQFISEKSSTIMDVKSVLGSRGRLVVNFWFEHDQQSIDLFELNLSTKELSEFWSPANKSLKLPYEVPKETSSIGGYIGLDVIAQKSKKQRWKTSEVIEFTSDLALNWIPDNQYSDLYLQIKRNQMSDETLNLQVEKIKAVGAEDDCLLLSEAELGVVKPDLTACQIVVNPLLGSSLYDTKCADLTSQWFDYILAKTRNICPLPKALGQSILPENKSDFNQAIQTALSSNMETVESTDLGQAYKDYDWMAERLNGLKESDATIKSFQSLVTYSKRFDAKLKNSHTQLFNFLTHAPVRDYVISELVRNQVLTQFRQRAEFAEWCKTQEILNVTENHCFNVASDVAVGFFTVYGFDDLVQFNLSMKDSVNAYQQWARLNLAGLSMQNSQQYLAGWANEFSETMSRNTTCASDILFPYSSLMTGKGVAELVQPEQNIDVAENSAPVSDGSPDQQDAVEAKINHSESDMLVLLREEQGSTTYKNKLQEMAKRQEQFLQMLWAKLAKLEESDLIASESEDCLTSILSQPVFTPLIGRITGYPAS